MIDLIRRGSKISTYRSKSSKQVARIRWDRSSKHWFASSVCDVNSIDFHNFHISIHQSTIREIFIGWSLQKCAKGDVSEKTANFITKRVFKFKRALSNFWSSRTSTSNYAAISPNINVRKPFGTLGLFSTQEEQTDDDEGNCRSSPTRRIRRWK